MKKIYLTVSLFLFLVAFSQEIKVVAAADLRFAFEEIKTEYLKKHPNVSFEITYGSSGTAYQKIVNGADYDIFYSADISYPQKLDSLKLTASKPKVYALGHLVLWSSNLDVSKGIKVLENPKISTISIANPRHAPYGKRAVECLKYYHLYDNLKTKIVEGENVSQAAQFALTGNAELGIIALSLALSPEMQAKGKFYKIDPKSYNKLEQAYVLTNNSVKNTAVTDFITFFESPKAKNILTKYGFGLPLSKK
ncbi:MAG: molybdate ABC transporter substrate-binding protein [Cytophagales bacterium]